MDIAKSVAQAMHAVPELEVLCLAGSLGRGGGDAFSDYDFVAAVATNGRDQVAARFREAIEDLAPVVLWRQMGRPPALINAVLKDWTRIDLFMTDNRAFSHRAQSDLMLLHDPKDIVSTLPKTAAPPDPKGRVAYASEEFIRVLGLLSGVMGRGELHTAIWGVALEKDQLITVMQVAGGRETSGGALHLSKTLLPEDLEALMALPYPGPDRGEVLRAHSAVARAFYPRARALAAELGINWPNAFEAATKDMLVAQCGSAAADWFAA